MEPRLNALGWGWRKEDDVYRKQRSVILKEDNVGGRARNEHLNLCLPIIWKWG